ARRAGARGEDAIPYCGARVELHPVEVRVRDHSTVGRAPALDAHPRNRRCVARHGAARRDRAHLRPPCAGTAVGDSSTRFTVAAMFSAVKPKNLKSAAAGADSPKRSRPTTAPRGSSAAPTYLRQPSVAPASTATRGIPGGNTLARYSGFSASNTRVHGIETTRAAIPSAASASRAPIAGATSEP